MVIIINNDLDFANLLSTKIKTKDDFSNIVMEMMENNLITENEYNVLSNMIFNNVIMNVYDYYDNNVYLSFNYISKITKIKFESLKGVLGSLIKKGLIFKENANDNYEGNQFSVSSYVYGVYSEEEFVKITNDM